MNKTTVIDEKDHSFDRVKVKFKKLKLGKRKVWGIVKIRRGDLPKKPEYVRKHSKNRDFRVIHKRILLSKGQRLNELYGSDQVLEYKKNFHGKHERSRKKYRNLI